MSRIILTLRRRSFIGKTALIGITDEAADGTLLGQRQLVGKIEEILPRKGIRFSLQDGQPFWLPPDHRPIKAAPKGEYRLRSTGQIVVDPDFLITWVVTQPAQPI